ncbi:hypothetical protein [Quadrisphaera sp. DSM 44207]|nr:hypothetical protein [Quadrisphaera sp. DSM 44207]SDQ51978.1 hypothetical protein SAMN05428996_2023 [Quadrisphaera sp. DSM 44207]
MERLRAQGRLVEATGDLPDVEPAPAREGPTLSEVLAEVRADERC